MTKIKLILTLFFSFLLISCVTRPPRDLNNLCSIFNQYPLWYNNALDVEKRWHIPIAVQMAIIHQESKFDAKAAPPQTKLLWFIPWSRPSSAYGYSQALRSTWDLYKNANNGGRFLASREVFADAVDFIGWYANQARVRAGISQKDAYHLYLAYHEGVTGYLHQSYLHKPWLMRVAKKVQLRAKFYEFQLARCNKKR